MAALKDKKAENKNTGSLAKRAKARASVTAQPDQVMDEGSQDRISAPSPLPTQIKAPLPDYPYIRSYAQIPSLRKTAGPSQG